MPKVPSLNFPTIKPPDKAVARKKAKEKQRRLFTKDDVNLTIRLKEVNAQLEELKAERREILKTLKERAKLARQGRLTPVKLYALRLADGCWYVGMTFNPEKRYRQHLKGKGATWTKLHRPLELVEVRVTTFYDQDSAAKLEDDMTLEYALKYGSRYVRGGGWCQTKPRWPDVVVQNELETPVL